MNSTLLSAHLVRIVACVVSLVVISGCSAVYVRHPVGEKTPVLLPARWNGVWLADDNSPVTVLVTSAERGQVTIGALEKKDQALSLSTETLLVRGSGQWFILNIPSTHEGRERFSWGLLKFNDDTALLWSPNIEKFRTLVRTGKLKGEAPETGDVYVDSISAVMLADLTKDNADGLIDWSNPLTLRRVKD